LKELSVDPCEQSPALLIAGLFLFCRRHLAELKLMEHLLPTLGGVDIRADVQWQVIEPPVALLDLGVVTPKAIP
jgi:hypothetical protein